MTPLKDFRRKATKEEQRELALRTGSDQTYLFSHIGVHREPSIETAAKIEEATTEMNKNTDGRLPVVRRTQLCEACNACPYAKGFLGNGLGEVGKANTD